MRANLSPRGRGGTPEIPTRKPHPRETPRTENLGSFLITYPFPHISRLCDAQARPSSPFRQACTLRFNRSAASSLAGGFDNTLIQFPAIIPMISPPPGRGTQFIRSRFVLVLDLFCKIQYCKDDLDSSLFSTYTTPPPL